MSYRVRSCLNLEGWRRRGRSSSPKKTTSSGNKSTTIACLREVGSKGLTGQGPCVLLVSSVHTHTPYARVHPRQRGKLHSQTLYGFFRMYVCGVQVCVHAWTSVCEGQRILGVFLYCSPPCSLDTGSLTNPGSSLLFLCLFVSQQDW